MATVVFQCGTCKKITASTPIHWEYPVREEYDEAVGRIPWQVVVSCPECRQITVLVFLYDEDQPATDKTSEFWIAAFEAQSPVVLSERPYHQWPMLISPPPRGVFTREIRNAWEEAERAFAAELWTSTAAAYRTVLELGLNKLHPRQPKETLHKQIDRLRAENAIGTELHALLMKAKAFGNRGAHESGLAQVDATVARDLCEAFLRQTYSVPYFLKLAATREAEIEERETKKQAAIAALQIRAQASKPST